jgi:hypothetical protein
MTRTTTLGWTFFCCAALAAGACRGGSNNGDDTPTPDAGGTDDVSIYDIQQDDGTLLGTEVNVRGVVITAIDAYGERVGNIWVQEPAGGAYSGVLVYGIELGVVADLSVGDLIDLEHVVVDEFALTEDTSGRTTTELTPPDGGAITVTVVGAGTEPAPEPVDALAIGQMTTADARDAEWEKWEGVLITLQNVSVLRELDQIGSTPQVPPFEEIQVTGPMRADTSLAAIDPVTLGDCLASVTGIGDYFFNYKILPRETSAIVAGGTGCPAQEADITACMDGIDNEADGFADCGDFSCQDAVPECATDTTIVMIQMDMFADGAPVALTDVFITAVDDIGGNQGFWAADSLTAAQYNGVYVYTGSTLPAGVAIGATATLNGTVAEFDLPVDPNPDPEGDTLTEVEADPANVAVTAGAGVPVPLTGVTATTLKDVGVDNLGEPYEGVLVQLAGMEVTSTASGDRLTVTAIGGETIVVDDDAYNYAAATYPVGTCFTTVTGVMSLNIFDNERRLMPTGVGDFVIDADGSDCN